MAKQPTRSIKTKQDLGSMDAIQHNDPAGAKKVMIIQPSVVRATTAGENVGPGRLVLIAATAYGLACIGRDYSATLKYQKGDVAVNSGSVYMANEDGITGTFDASKWILKAAAIISNVNAPTNSVVTTGRWHNSVSVAGFLVDDDSSIDYISIKD